MKFIKLIIENYKSFQFATEIPFPMNKDGRLPFEGFSLDGPEEFARRPPEKLLEYFRQFPGDDDRPVPQDLGRRLEEEDDFSGGQMEDDRSLLA